MPAETTGHAAAFTICEAATWPVLHQDRHTNPKQYALCSDPDQGQRIHPATAAAPPWSAGVSKKTRSYTPQVTNQSTNRPIKQTDIHKTERNKSDKSSDGLRRQSWTDAALVLDLSGALLNNSWAQSELQPHNALQGPLTKLLLSCKAGLILS